MISEEYSSEKCQFNELKVAVIACGTSTSAPGGAERLFDGLVNGLSVIGCQVKLISLPADEPSFSAILENYKRFQSLNLSNFDVVISTKAPTYAVNHPCHVMYLVHTVRVFDDMFGNAFPVVQQNHFLDRSTLHHLDFNVMCKIKARFAIGHEVAKRLYRWRGLDAQVLHPPLTLQGFRCERIGDYFFLPGRLHPWKRVDLVIDAVRKSSLPLRLIISGTGEAEADLKSHAGKDPRIEFVGRVSDEKMIELYANALAIPFVPLKEDYGYVTLEAFASGKPVVTCTDSGEPTHFVQNGSTGLICEPNPDSIQNALEWLFTHRDDAKRMGQRGKELTADMSWPDVARRLVEAALCQVEQKQKTDTSVAVLDMQPIDPPVGGGRLRLLGLYHNLGKEIKCRYVGTYDWPGEHYRAHALSETLFEIDIPLSDAHHIAAAALAKQAGGKVVIDLAFSKQAMLSPDYVAAARREVADADVVIFSHPWVYQLVKDCIQPNQVVIYDSHNVEGFLRAQLLNDQNPTEAELLRQVVQDEYDLGCRADWIWACSQEDLLRFNRVYSFPLEKMRVVPNGVMAFNNSLPTPEKRIAAREALGLDAKAFIAIFLGSSYGPNVQAAEFINKELAGLAPQVTFVIAGGVGASMRPSHENVLITGHLDEPAKYRWLQSSDIAINPMMSGSGTNIKMFDFMAMSLPVVTTDIGARGIETAGRQVMLIADQNAEAIVDRIEQLREESTRSKIGKEARMCVEDNYAWERISEQLGVFLRARKRLAGQPHPLFSVVVPTYERHDQLEKLISYLQKQIERDFEVIVVDQSNERWKEADENYIFPLTYFHSPVKGAARARNTGAMLAQGKIIAFIDDDCLPEKDWLLNARPYFFDPAVVGIEGLIYSDHLFDPKWRTVTNVGFEGIGFMTANLMVRSSVFQYLGGFDLQFDRPHFREDTDLGWRMQDIGSVPYAKDVKVFHPAQPREVERESNASRARFFEKDALLYKKHPERYKKLFLLERHFENTEGFSENLIRGFMLQGIDLPSWIKPYLKN